MPKVLSIRFAIFLLGLILFVSLAYLRTSSLKIADARLTPVTIYPNPQNGYGKGDDQLAQPDDVEILADGRIVASDVDNHRIQIFTPDGRLERSITSRDMGLDLVEIIPTGLAMDAANNLYATLEGAGRIAKFNADLAFDKFIGIPGEVTSGDYYKPENNGLLMNPQGLIVNAWGDVFVVDMAQDVFKQDGVRNFGFRKFKRIVTADGETYIYDEDFARTQEITTVMRKSEGMAISEERNILFIAEEKPAKNQFGNSKKFRYIAAFELSSGKFLNRLYGVVFENDAIISGYCDDSIEGLSVHGDYLYAVVEKEGRVDAYHIDTGERSAHFGIAAPFYCDDESDCVIDGVNYNEQNIMAGVARVHTLNDWRKNELASPDGICVKTLADGSERLAVVDQWNSRILLYHLEDVLGQE
jgi:hypothetical protein